MITGMWGRKIGMTQVFSQDKVIPVTAIDVGNWFVTGVKTTDNDGYDAVQVGCVKGCCDAEKFSSEWIKKPKKNFSLVREVKLLEATPDLKVGNAIDFESVLKEGQSVDVFGKTKGKGFAGVVRRYNFSGGSASHGSKTGRKPGSIGFMCSCGRVVKGKKMPGRMGNAIRMMKNLSVVRFDKEANVVLIKGAIPGTKGSFVFIRKQGKES